LTIIVRAIAPLRNSLNDFLHALDANHPLRAAGDSPALPALVGMPSYVETNDDAGIAAVAALMDKERRLLNRYIETEGYNWVDMYSGAA
jgi:hypothetical protein